MAGKNTKNKSMKDGIKKSVENIDKSVYNIFHSRKTLGQRASDVLAKSAGSWGFIIGFVVFLLLWMAANVYLWVNTWDPYPFILLNLVLSCLAAIQAPIILMSQNRQSEKDRRKAQYDYDVDRKTSKQVDEIRKQLNRIEKRINN